MGFSNGGFDVGTAVAYLDLNTLAFNKAIEESQRMFQTFADTSTTAAQKWQSVGQNLTNFGSSLTRNVTTPILGLAQSSINAYRDFESAFTGVRKTVELSEADMKKLGVTWDDLSDIIVNMAKNTASSSEEIAGVMEIAGQLGVPLGKSGKDIEKFTKTMVMLGDSTNLSAAEAANALARFSNITGGNVSNIDKLGSAIVSLGNNFATQEDEIVMMSTRLASAGTIAGLTETEILALATAMTSVGIKAEAGGTAMSTTLSQITKIIAAAMDTTSEGAGEAQAKLETLASVAGMTSEEFVRTWKNEPIKAVQAFIGGLGNMSEDAESTILTLDELGMTSIRQSNMLRSLALSSENLSNALKTSNSAYEENTALTDEANKRYETLDSQINQLNERWKEMKRDIAEILIPILNRLMDILEKLIDWWMGLDDETKESIVNFGLFVAALGPVLSAIGNIITVISTFARILEIIGPGIKNFKDALFLAKHGCTDLAKVISPLFKTLSGIGSVIGGVVKTISGIAMVIGGAILSVKSFVDMWKNGWSIIKTILEALGIALVAVGAILLGAPAAITAIIAAIVFALSQIVLAVKQHWGDIKNFFANTIPNWWINTVMPWFQSVGDSIGNFFSNVQSVVSDVMSKIKQGVGNFFNSIYENCSQQMKAILSSISNIVKSILDVVEELLHLLVERIKTFFLTIWYTITGNFEKVKETLSNFIEYVKLTFENIVNIIVKIFNNIGNLLNNFFGLVIPKVKEFFSNIIESVSSFVSNVFSKISSFFQNVVGNVGIMLSSIFEKVSSSLSSLVSNIVNFISNVLGKVGEFASNMINKAKELGSGFLSAIWEKISEIPGKIKNIFDTVLNFLSGLYDRFFGSGKNIFQGLWDGLKSIWNSIWGWLQGIWDAVIGFFSNLWGRISGGVGSFFNGSHANGLSYVPFNGYVAQLHEGERVLTKQEARDYNNDKRGGSGDTYNFYNTKPDPYEYSRQMKIAKVKQSITGNNSPSETSPIYV